MKAQIDQFEPDAEERQLLEFIDVIVANPADAKVADRPLHMICLQLINSQPASNPTFRQALRTRLLTTLSEQPNQKSGKMFHLFSRPMRMVIASILIMIGLLIALFVTYPPVRVWAQELLDRIGPFTFTTGPTLPEQALTHTPEPFSSPTANNSTPDAGASYQNMMTLEEAQKQVSFAILKPKYLPENMTFSSVAVMPGSPSGEDVSSTYVNTNNGDVVIIRQFPYAGDSLADFPIGNAPTTEVKVRGKTGIWVEKANLGLQPEGQLIQWSFLIWQEEAGGKNFILWMFTHTLSQTEMLKIAESLAP